MEEQIKYFNISDEGDLMTKEVLPIEFSSKVFELTVKAEDVDGKFGKKIRIREQFNINFNEWFHFVLEGMNAMI